MTEPITETLFVPSGCRIPRKDASQDVALQYGIYHDPDKLGTTIDMEIVGESVAYYDREAVPCSRCFNAQQITSYPFPYLRDPMPTTEGLA